MACVKIVSLVLVIVACASAKPKPLDSSEHIESMNTFYKVHNVQKRFINPSLTSGSFDDGGYAKMRTKRSEKDCEKLALCKLHARSGRSFFATYALYFVNKENAKLWDHQPRTLADCERRYRCYDR
ncbi:uncharacterized protein LOC128200201 [Galleria mellonella]|uniref:Uncharacterized protein LOC128200201 n=1 Tax=Galleria mellonella TaxID=7137 RepID=A0ABM3MBI3_GALME|nr:uncharacterized protein LOC128200201 [Galleria mellonella]